MRRSTVSLTTLGLLGGLGLLLAACDGGGNSVYEVSGKVFATIDSPFTENVTSDLTISATTDGVTARSVTGHDGSFDMLLFPGIVYLRAEGAGLFPSITPVAVYAATPDLHVELVGRQIFADWLDQAGLTADPARGHLVVVSLSERMHEGHGGHGEHGDHGGGEVEEFRPLPFSARLKVSHDSPFGFTVTGAVVPVDAEDAADVAIIFPNVYTGKITLTVEATGRGNCGLDTALDNVLIEPGVMTFVVAACE